MIEVGAGTLRHRDGFVDARAMRVAGLEDVAAVVFEENIFAIVDVALALPIGHFLNPSAQPIVPIGARERRRGIPGHEVFHLGQPILRIVGVLRVVAGGEQRFPGQIPVVVVLIGVRGIRRELIPGVHDRAACRPVAHRVIGEALRRAEERMAGAGQSV